MKNLLQFESESVFMNSQMNHMIIQSRRLPMTKLYQNILFLKVMVSNSLFIDIRREMNAEVALINRFLS